LQLGVGANAGSWAANARPMQISPSRFENATVVDLAGGASHSLVLTTKEGQGARVWAFGSNANGQLGVSEQFGVWGGAVSLPR